MMWDAVGVEEKAAWETQTAVIDTSADPERRPIAPEDTPCGIGSDEFPISPELADADIVESV